MAFINDQTIKAKLDSQLAKLQGKTTPIEQEKEAEKVWDMLADNKKTESVITTVPSSKNFNLKDAMQTLEEEAPFAKHFNTDWKKAMIGLKMLHNCPYEFSAVCLLAYTNIATHHIYNVNSHLYGIRPSSLYVAVLLQSGGLKSTIGGELSGPFNEFIRHWMGVLQNEDARYGSDMKLYKKEIQQYEKDREDGIITPFPVAPKPAEKAKYKMKTATTAGMLRLLNQQPMLNLVTPEGVGFFKGHAFQDDTRALQMSDLLIDLWDGSALSYDLKEEKESYHIENRRFNMTIMAQYGPIASVLNNQMFQEQGFIHRILLANIKPFKKRKLNEDNPEQDDIDNAVYRQLIEPYLNRLTQLFEERWKIKKDFDENDMDFQLDLKTKNFTLSARKHLNAYYNATEYWGDEGNRLERYEGFSQRLHEQMIRCACTISAYDKGANDIDELDILNAIEFIEMFIDMRVSITQGMIDSNPALTNNSKILAHWFKSRKGEKFTKRELNRTKGKCTEFAKLQANSDAQEVILSNLLKSELIIGVKSIAKNGSEVVEYTWNIEGEIDD